MRYNFNSEKHLHTLDGRALTGTSSVVDVLAKPLTWWSAGLACETLGWKNGKYCSEEDRVNSAKEALQKISALSPEEYLKLLDKAYRAHHDSKNKAADKGTDLHAELESWVKAQMGKVPEKISYDPQIQPFIDWAKKNVKTFLWSEAHCYSERLWTGGISDTGVELNDGTVAVIDYKSSKEAYTGQFIQCAGYALEIEESGLFSEDGMANKKLDKKITALIVVPFRSKPVLPVIMRDVDAYKKAFEAAVVLYRLIFNNNETK